MAKLALAIGYTKEANRQIPVDRQTSRSAFSALGDTVLLYQPASDSIVVFHSLGKVVGVEIGSDGRILCSIQDVRPLAAVQPLEQPVTARVRRMLLLELAQFDGIVSAGRVTSTEEPGLNEAQGGAADSPVDDLAPRQVYRQVLEAYGYRCAVTGKQFPVAAIPDDLYLVFIRPRNQGGPLHVRNLMPMCPEAAADWDRGSISATDDHLLTLVWAHLSGEVAEALETYGGKLHLPTDPRYRPSPEHLAYHRETIFGR